LFLSGSVCDFQALCGEATVLVRPAHSVQPSMATIFAATREGPPMFPKLEFSLM
jgi:hypothetical protein